MAEAEGSFLASFEQSQQASAGQQSTEQQGTSEPRVHAVARGENLTTIAERYGVSVKDLVRYNGLRNANRIAAGQQIRIPPSRTQLGENESDDNIHYVQRGENLTAIAKRFGVSVREIARANGITDLNFVDVGQALVIPGLSGQTIPDAAAPEPPGREQIYRVRSGDALARIARRYSVTVRELMRVNGIRNPNRIRRGQRLRIPATGYRASRRGRRPARSQPTAPRTEAASTEVAPPQPEASARSAMERSDASRVSPEIARETGLSSGEADTSRIANSPELQAIIAQVLRVAPRHDYARGAIPGILRQAAASGVRNANQVAYILATAHHESDFGKPTFRRSQSLVEDANRFRRSGRNGWSARNHVNGRYVRSRTRAGLERKYWDSAYGGRLGNRRGTDDAMKYRGRGYVQLTGRSNYRKMSKMLNEAGFTYEMDGVVWGKDKPIDLVANPTHVNRHKELAARIMVDGMMKGSFTGRALGQYVNNRRTDFYNARSVVNGDKRKNGRSIQRLANRYARALRGWSKVFKEG